MSNCNFGKHHSKWICNCCGLKNTDKSIKPYVIDGCVLYLCENCMNNLNEQVNVIEHNFVEGCYYL